jgi:hypothetical protein
MVVGGVAGVIHGASRATFDIDLVYSRNDRNLASLAAALSPFRPYLRDAPAGLPFQLDPATLRGGLNFTLTTLAGDVDLLGEVPGGGSFENLRSHSTTVQAFGVDFLCVDLPTLIHLKLAAGRAKDLEAVAELQRLAASRSPAPAREPNPPPREGRFSR